MNSNDKTILLNSLWAYISETRKKKMCAVVENRTHYVTVVVEDVFQPHNASAILRSCDIFGVQNVHIIENNYSFKPVKTIAMGSVKWLDIHKYSSIEQSIGYLKKAGYTMVATTPHTTAYELPSLPLDNKIAFMFGSEQTGLSELAMKHADMAVKIPMYGFVESFNVSVSVALCLYDTIMRLHRSSLPWQLSEEEKIELLLAWVKKVSKTARALAE
jgi:tRNA (guanosine-2'-O-)-methyltransferase